MSHLTGSNQTQLVGIRHSWNISDLSGGRCKQLKHVRNNGWVLSTAGVLCHTHKRFVVTDFGPSYAQERIPRDFRPFKGFCMTIDNYKYHDLRRVREWIPSYPVVQFVVKTSRQIKTIMEYKVIPLPPSPSPAHVKSVADM